jgi:hypothetical protein
MPPSRRIDLTLDEHNGELTVQAVRENSLLEQIAAFAVALVLLCLLWEDGGKMAQVVAAVGALLLAVGYLHARRRRNTITLYAGAGELRTEGRNALTLPFSDVQLMQYDPGDEDDPCGLYVFVPEAYHCLLPHLDEAQTKQVLQALENNFPGLTANRTPTGSLNDTSRGMMNLWIDQQK